METPGPAMVFLSQAWYHNWKARVDGKTVPLWRANEAFQAIESPPGRQEIVLTYEDTAFQWGALASVIGLVLCGICWKRYGTAKASIPSTRA